MNDKEQKAMDKSLKKSLGYVEKALGELEKKYEEHSVKPLGDAILTLITAKREINKQL